MTKRATLEEAERTMQSLARVVGNMTPQGWGFAVLCFSFGENGFMNWVSNAERQDMIKALIPPPTPRSRVRFVVGGDALAGNIICEKHRDKK